MWEPPYDKHMNAILMTKPGFCHRPRRLFDMFNTNNSFEIQAVFSVAQCIFYNSTFRHHKQATGTYCNTMSEPPLPIYVGLLLHGETRKRSLVDKYYDLCISVSYDRVSSISADLGNDISELYKSEGVVCPRQLRREVFTTASYDNIDHNPSSNTALGALHGTAISLFQYDSCHTNPGEARIIESHVSSSQQETRHFQKSTQMFNYWFCPRIKPKFHRLIVL